MKFILQEIEKELHFSFPEHTVFLPAERDLTVTRDQTTLTVRYASPRQLFRAAILCKTHPAEAFSITETTPMEDITFMVDCSRCAVYTVQTLQKLMRNLAATGYTSVMLYIEDEYEVPEEPCFGYLRGRYKKQELKEIVAYGDSIGIEVIPCMQTLGHLERITRYEPYKNGLFDYGNILMVGEETTYTFLAHLFASLRECFTTKKIHIGMDEAHMLGLGRYLQKHGLRDRFDILTEHLGRVCALAEQYGFSPNMWSDMFFRLANPQGDYHTDVPIPQKVYDNLPENIALTYWDYGSTNFDRYDKRMALHQKMNRPVWFAGGSWKWGGMLPGNFFSIAAQRASLDACLKNRVQHIINTAWGDDGAEASLFSILPTLSFFGLYTYGYPDEEIRAQFLPLTGYGWEEFMNLERPNTFGQLLPRHCHTTKVVLYNDPFLGAFDADLDPDKHKESFRENAALLRSTRKGQYDYLFDFAAALTETVYVKYDLGIRLRKAYQAKDREGFSAALAQLREVQQKVKALYPVFRNQWFTESKPYGFEVQDVRFGGLERRLQSCAERAEAYLNGEIDRIEELEETILPGVLVPIQEGGSIYFPSYNKITSPNL